MEPAIEGEKNGLDLRITKAGVNVEGAGKTLKFDVTHVQSKATKTYPIRGVFGSPRRCTVDLIPTLTARYRFRIYGDLSGTFGNVEPVKELLFPVAAAQPRELEGAVRGAADEAQSARRSRRAARPQARARWRSRACGWACSASCPARAASPSRCAGGNAGAARRGARQPPAAGCLATRGG